jgi:NADH dehydrogenase FAD-containing subunit
VIFILGSGYAGLNAYYNIKGGAEKILLSHENKFVFYTAYLRNLIKNTKYEVSLNFVRKEDVKDVDISNLEIKTDKGEYKADKIIIALGCKRPNLEYIMERINNKNVKEEMCITAEDEYDDYLALQITLYSKIAGKNVRYHGNFLSYLGNKVANVVSELTQKYIKTCEEPNLIIEKCVPPEFTGLLSVNSYLEVKKSVYAIGDIIKGWPKLGELAMREGIYIGKKISGKLEGEFEPIYIHIVDTGREGIHIRSKVPWGINYQEVKVSKIRSLMKRFIEKYYIWRKGNMGFLYYL